MDTPGGGHGEPVERGPQEGAPAQQDGSSTRSVNTGAGRVERELGTPVVGGEQHWTPAAVGSDATSQILLSITRWFPIGRWFRRRRERRGDTGETSGSDR
jgi:hypothetical protein